MQSKKDMMDWEAAFAGFLQAKGFHDASHDLGHIRRVVRNAKRIGTTEQANLEVVIPAAWLHDCVMVEKNAPNRGKASTMAAEHATRYLNSIGYPEHHIRPIAHAIQAHSFSAGIPPETLEAKVVQDADRLDALGAIGLARCFMVGERLGLSVYHPTDPFAQSRTPDDKQFIIDHFYVKLLKLPGTMQTATGRADAQRRAERLTDFLDALAEELVIGDL